MDLDTLQVTVESYLNADSYIHNAGVNPIPVLRENLKDVKTKVQEIVYKAQGLFIFLVTPTGSNPKPNIFKPGPIIEPSFAIQVVENVTRNRGADGIGEPAAKVAEHIAGLLHTCLAVGTPILKSFALDGSWGALLVYKVVFTFPYTNLVTQTRS